MALHLVTGKANAGKSGVVNARLLESLANGEAPSLIVPTVVDARRAEAEFATKAPVGIEVSSWSQWLQRLWSVHGDGRRLISRAARAAFIDRAIRESGQAPVAITPGLNRLFADAAGAMTHDVAASQPTSRALAYLLKVLDRYVRLIGTAGLVETTAVLAAFAAVPPEFNGTIAFNRFNALSTPQMHFIEALSHRSDVVVALTWADDFAPTTALDETVRRLALAADLFDRIEETDSESEIAKMGNALFSTGGLRAQGSVAFGVAAGEEAEGALIARHVAHAVSSGIPEDRIIVAFPRLGRQGDIVARALHGEGIDTELDMVRPLDTTTIGRAIGELLDLTLNAGGRATASSLLFGAYSDMDPEQAARLDADWRTTRVDEGHRLLAGIASAGTSRLSKAAATALRLRDASCVADVNNWESLLGDLLSAAATKALGSDPVIDAASADRLGTDAATARAVAGLLGEMLSVEGGQLTAGDVRTALREVAVGGTTGERPGAVQITEFGRIGSRRFDVVVLAGLTAEEAPVGGIPGLLDEVRALVGSEPPADQDALVRFGFYHAVSRARSALVLVRREADGQGRALRPSVLWEEAVEVYRLEDEDADEWPCNAPRLERLAAVQIAESAPAFTAGRREQRVNAAKKGAVHKRGHRGRLNSPSALEAVGSLDVFSATEVETYLACPYRWFYDRVVRPDEIDRGFDAREIGTFAHGLIRRFYAEAVTALEAGRVTADNLDQSRALLADVANRVEAETRVKGLSEQLAIEQARRWVEKAVEADATLLPGFVPVEHELKFPAEGGVPIVLGGASFVGRIDRVDRSAHAVFVTDYKSSRTVSGQDSFVADGKVQALVYARAAEAMYGLPCAGSVYRSFKSGELRGFWRADLIGGALTHGNVEDSLGEARLAELTEATEDSIAEAIAGMRSGRIPRSPAGKTQCRYCGIAGLCQGSAS